MKWISSLKRQIVRAPSRGSDEAGNEEESAPFMEADPEPGATHQVDIPMPAPDDASFSAPDEVESVPLDSPRMDPTPSASQEVGLGEESFVDSEPKTADSPPESPSEEEDANEKKMGGGQESEIDDLLDLFTNEGEGDEYFDALVEDLEEVDVDGLLKECQEIAAEVKRARK